MLPSGFHNSLVTGSSFHGDVTAEARLSSLAEKEGEREAGAAAGYRQRTANVIQASLSAEREKLVKGREEINKQYSKLNKKGSS